MKKHFFITGALVILPVVAGCDIELLPKEELPVPISISTTLTKVSGDRFETGDAIGLFVVNGTASDNGEWTSGTLAASGNHIDNGKYVFSGTWETDGEYYWKDSETQAEFYCYYPYKEDIGNNHEAVSFAVPADQSTAEAFKSAEILWGRTGMTAPTEKRVNITATHRTGQIVIEIVPGKGFTQETLAESLGGVTVNGLKCNASLNLKDGSLKASGEASDIKPYKDGDVWKALVVPQSVDNEALVTIIVDGQPRVLVQTVDFTPNSIKKCTITVNKINEGINVGIGGWEDDSNDYGGILN